MVAARFQRVGNPVGRNRYIGTKDFYQALSKIHNESVTVDIQRLLASRNVLLQVRIYPSKPCGRPRRCMMPLTQRIYGCGQD
jgi:hypothetical protein